MSSLELVFIKMLCIMSYKTNWPLITKLLKAGFH